MKLIYSASIPTGGRAAEVTRKARRVTYGCVSVCVCVCVAKQPPRPRNTRGKVRKSRRSNAEGAEDEIAQSFTNEEVLRSKRLKVPKLPAL